MKKLIALSVLMLMIGIPATSFAMEKHMHHHHMWGHKHHMWHRKHK